MNASENGFSHYTELQILPVFARQIFLTRLKEVGRPVIQLPWSFQSWGEGK
jgi:hypothetical protein